MTPPAAAAAEAKTAEAATGLADLAAHSVIKVGVVVALAQLVELEISLRRGRLSPTQTAEDGGQVGLSCGDSGQTPLAAGQVCGNARVSTFQRLVALCGVSHKALVRPDLPFPSLRYHQKSREG